MLHPAITMNLKVPTKIYIQYTPRVILGLTTLFFNNKAIKIHQSNSKVLTMMQWNGNYSSTHAITIFFWCDKILLNIIVQCSKNRTFFQKAHQVKSSNNKVETLFDGSKSSWTPVQLPNLNSKTWFSRFKNLEVLHPSISMNLKVPTKIYIQFTQRVILGLTILFFSNKAIKIHQSNNKRLTMMQLNENYYSSSYAITKYFWYDQILLEL